MCFIHKPMTTWTTFAVTLRRTYVLSLAVILGLSGCRPSINAGAEQQALNEQQPAINQVPNEPAGKLPPPNSGSGSQSEGSQSSASTYAIKLRSVVVSRSFQPIGDSFGVPADSQGNKLFIQRATCKDVSDGHCEKLFIALNGRFLGTDTYLPSWGVRAVYLEGVGSFSAVYDDFSDPSQTPPPIKVIYTWDGKRLTAFGTPPTRNNGKSRAPSASSGFTQPFATSTPFPPVHNSPDTECAYHRQCTDDEFVGLLESLQRQWGLTPEWLRSKCVANYTYPSIEDCILNQTVSWLNTHPHEQAPWINIDVFQPKTTQ